MCITFSVFSWTWLKLSFIKQNEKLMYISFLNIVSLLVKCYTQLKGMLINPISKIIIIFILGIKVQLLQALRHAKLKKVLNTSTVKKVALRYLVNSSEKNNFYKCS